jgi:hypothetical protein
MANKEMNVAIIGYKFMGKAHSQAWRDAPAFFDPGIKPVLKLACGRHEDQLKAFADRWGWEETTTDWREAVARDDIDIIDISAPTYLHHDIAIAAAEAGKHQLPTMSRRRPRQADDRGREAGPDLPLARRVPSVLDHRPQLPAHLAPQEGDRRLRAPP